MFRQLSLKLKLQCAFLAFSFVLLMVGILGVYSAKSIFQSYDQVTSISTPKMLSLIEMKASYDKLLSLLIQTALAGNPPSEIERLQGRMRKMRDAFEMAEKQYLSVSQEKDEQALFENMKVKLAGVDKYFQQTLPLASTTNLKDKMAFTEAYGGDFMQARFDLYKSIDDLIELQKKHSHHWIEEAELTARSDRRKLMGLVFIGFFGALLFGYGFSRQLATQLHAVAGSISGGADSVSEFSNKLQSAGDSLAAAVTEQAAALQQTSAAIVQLNSMVDRTAENAVQSKILTLNSQKVADRGRSSVLEMVDAIEEIRASNQDTVAGIQTNHHHFEEIIKVIGEIATKTNVINDIVFQTKLLSFNASVEAARAGEFGKGFAVVAEEVGNLAAMSGTAAHEISEMLKSSVQKVEAMTASMSSEIQKIVAVGSSRVERGKSIADVCRLALEEMVQNVNEVTVIAEQISSASDEQRHGIREIAQAMQQLDETTQRNSTSATDTASCSVELLQEVIHLREMVARLKNTVEGERRVKQSSPKALKAA